MADSTLPSLDAIQARADAATEGPWEASGSHVATSWTGASDWSGPIDDREPVATASPVDAAFIAAARTDVPVLVAALRAVLALHEPYTIWAYDDVTGAWIYDENDEQVVVAVACRECTPDASIERLGDCEWTEDDPIVVHPCPTVRAITAHIDTTPKEKP